MAPAPDHDDPVTKLDGLVRPAAEPENAVLTDDARAVRWAGPLFALFSVILLPWIGYLAVSLPARQLSSNYDAAWAGFDVILFCGLAATAVCARAGPVTCPRPPPPRPPSWSSTPGSTC
jgi:hypothetical protein